MEEVKVDEKDHAQSEIVEAPCSDDDEKAIKNISKCVKGKDKEEDSPEEEEEEEQEDEEKSDEDKNKKEIAQSKPTETNNSEDSKPSQYSTENVHYEGDTAIYTDPNSGHRYQWCTETNQWQLKSGAQYGFENDTHTYTDESGMKYFWDKDKSAWFPQIDDEFMARYQMSYGFVDNTSKPEQQPEKPDQKVEEVEKEDEENDEKKQETKGVKRKVPPPPPSWFEINEKENTKVYVSNLPTDITEEEFVDLMQKCGLVMKDPISGKMKVKLYTVPDTDILKGDGLCTYIRIESVDLALKLLDGYVHRGKKIQVERAKFQMKGEYNPNLKPKKKKKKEKDKIKKMQEQLFDWRPEKMRGERSKHERIVIVKNLFEPSLFDDQVSLILEYQQDLREECSKLGLVRKVILYDRHPEGVAQINMKEPEEADEVVKLLNGRWFCQRQLTAEIWNGKTKYKIAETDSEIKERLNKWDDFLVTGETKKEEDNKENPKLEEQKTNTDKIVTAT